jgi:intracellular multiplication protein IcmK
MTRRVNKSVMAKGFKVLCFAVLLMMGSTAMAQLNLQQYSVDNVSNPVGASGSSSQSKNQNAQNQGLGNAQSENANGETAPLETNKLSLTSLARDIASAKNVTTQQQANTAEGGNGNYVQDANALFQPNGMARDAAFTRVSRQALPMTPGQVVKLKKMIAATQQAAATVVGTPPKPVTSSLIVSLAPGASPPVVHLQKGFVTSLVFVDSGGQKWPIDGFDIGDKNAFDVQWTQGTNILLVQARSLYTYGNLAVKLRGLSTPVMVTLIPGQSVVDYRVDLHVSGKSPTSNQSINSSYGPGGSSGTNGGAAGSQGGSESQGIVQSGADQVLLNVLNAVPPAGAKDLTVSGASCDTTLNNCRAWIYRNKLYLRIPYSLLSPGWISDMQSSDGMKAYILQKTPTVLISDYGKSGQLSIEGY